MRCCALVTTSKYKTRDCDANSPRAIKDSDSVIPCVGRVNAQNSPSDPVSRPESPLGWARSGIHRLIPDNMLYHSLYGEPLIFPLYLALLSIAIFGSRASRVFRVLFEGRVDPARTVPFDAPEDQDDPGLYYEHRWTTLISSIKKSVREMGSVTFVLKSLRVLSCIALVAISIAASIMLKDSREDWSAHGVGNAQWRHANSIKSTASASIHSRWTELIKALFYVSHEPPTSLILFAY